MKDNRGSKSCWFVSRIQKERRNCNYLGHLNFENPWVVRDQVEWKLWGTKLFIE
jgi:hypothetical protein